MHNVADPNGIITYEKVDALEHLPRSDRDTLQ